MIICSQCGGTLANGEKICGECGAHIAPVRVKVDPRAAVQRQPLGNQEAAYAQVRAPITPVATKPQTNPIVWVAVTVGVLVLVIISVVGFSISKKTNDSGSAAAKTGGRIAYSKFNGVHVRDAPNSNATVITDIQKNQAVRVVRESPNYDTVFIQSLNKTVTDNWSEIQVDSTSVHGWIFSGFIR